MADRANAAYLALWKTSAYSNLGMMQYIIEKKFPSAKRPWLLFLEECDGRIPPSTSQDARDRDRDRWTAASKAISNKKTKLFGSERPIWDDRIPESLWAGGNGLCTSFAIAVDHKLAFEANLVAYNGHRAAHKINPGDKSVVVLDSAARHAFELPDGAHEASWANTGGMVSWHQEAPKQVTDCHEAMRLCLDQLFNKAKFGLTLYRILGDSDVQGEFGTNLQFSPFHRAFKMIDGARDGKRWLRYVLFACSAEADAKAECAAQLADFGARVNELNPIAVTTMTIFDAALEHWRTAALSNFIAVDVKMALREWPEPVM